MVKITRDRNTAERNAFTFRWTKLKERANLFVRNIDGKDRFKMYQKY
jgi:hypothetical protein